MKIKKFEKKLVLNKKTIANLGSNEMKNANGGLSVPDNCFELPGIVVYPHTYSKCFTQCVEGGLPC